MKIIEPELVKIPAGEAVLRLPVCPPGYSLEHPWVGPRRVQVGEIRIARYAVTRREYRAFLEDAGWAKPIDWGDPTLDNDRQPVCGVSAEDADAYCAWLARKTGKPYRLPGVDEWEKAARGGLAGKKFPWGDEEPAGRACYGGTEKDRPKPVGSCPPNGFGLYDMVGNVWQWLADRYADIGADKPMNTPTGKPPDNNRVLVGGSFMTLNPAYLWLAYKEDDPPDLQHRCCGFRLALKA